MSRRGNHQSAPYPSHRSTGDKDSSTIDVFTDGACRGNGKGSGIAKAGYSVVFPEFPGSNVRDVLPAGSAHTSNRAEYTAVQQALRIADRIDPAGERKVRIHTDSQLLVKSVTQWSDGWRENGWRKSDGAPVKNVDLLKPITENIRTRNAQVEFVHVPAHTGRDDWKSTWNDKADKMAKDSLK